MSVILEQWVIIGSERDSKVDPWYSENEPLLLLNKNIVTLRLQGKALN